MEFLERRSSAEMCVAATHLVNRGHCKAYGIGTVVGEKSVFARCGFGPLA
jgi:hypothetical protein